MDKDFKLKKGDKIVWVFGNDKNNKYTSIITENGYTVKEFEDYDKVLKVLRPTGYKTVYEAKKEILDEKEKEYLSAVIKPFKNRVEYIIKKPSSYNSTDEYIVIELINDDCIALPYFDKRTMYKGMETDKKYTLKELGLD